MSCLELVNLPVIGIEVRCKAPIFRNSKGTTGYVKAILSEGRDSTVVIQCTWGSEIAVSVTDFPSFFEEYASEDVAWEYRASA